MPTWINTERPSAKSPSPSSMVRYGDDLVLYSTAQEARKQLHFLFDWLWQQLPDLGGADPVAYKEAAAALRGAPRAHRYDLPGRRSRVTRLGRVVRIGDEGPEGPRPSDVDMSEPSESPHPRMDEDGAIHDDA